MPASTRAAGAPRLTSVPLLSLLGGLGGLLSRAVNTMFPVLKGVGLSALVAKVIVSVMTAQRLGLVVGGHSSRA